MFKKTVSMHEVFLQRLAAHPVLRNDNNFRVFLEYKEDVKKIIKKDKRFLYIKILIFLVKCSW
jgi:sorting nexin-5/6/32